MQIFFLQRLQFFPPLILGSSTPLLRIRKYVFRIEILGSVILNYKSGSYMDIFVATGKKRCPQMVVYNLILLNLLSKNFFKRLKIRKEYIRIRLRNKRITDPHPRGQLISDQQDPEAQHCCTLRILKGFRIQSSLCFMPSNQPIIF